MFGYILPPPEDIAPQEHEQFRLAYCGLCHTLQRRYGFVSRFILNYDFTYLAILLSSGEQVSPCKGRCPVSPLKQRQYHPVSDALDLAADESVILTYWQLMDGIADHNFWKGLKYRVLASALRPSYQKAATLRPRFAAMTQEKLQILARLEEVHSASLDEPADTFAAILSAAADEVSDPVQSRVLHQLLYHLGRWVYLIDAADDLEKDLAAGNYNPIAFRYKLKEGRIPPEVRPQFVLTLDHSIHMAATAFELWDFGVWTGLLTRTIYDSLFAVGRSVLDGTFHTLRKEHKKYRLLRKPNERSLSDSGCPRDCHR